jgi:hypothetical protein
MNKIIWTVSLAAVVAVVGCGDLADAPDDGAAAATGGDGDLDIDPGGDSRCGKDSLDVEGCACTPGAPLRSCSAGNPTAPGGGTCVWGVQACITGGSGEIQSSAWGPCEGSVVATEEGCDKVEECQPDVEECGSSSSGGDTPNDPQDPQDPGDTPGLAECCADEVAACESAGEPAALCDALEQRCNGGSCDGLTAICDTTAVPVSTTCARMYYECFEFRVNKCMRESYDQCLYRMGDATLCGAWDAACGAREAYCGTIFSDPLAPEYTYLYACTDWGHLFEPCWAEYQGCSLGQATCMAAMDECLGALDDIYYGICPKYGDGNDDA